MPRDQIGADHRPVSRPVIARNGDLQLERPVRQRVVARRGMTPPRRIADFHFERLRPPDRSCGQQLRPETDLLPAAHRRRNLRLQTGQLRRGEIEQPSAARRQEELRAPFFQRDLASRRRVVEHPPLRRELRRKLHLDALRNSRFEHLAELPDIVARRPAVVDEKNRLIPVAETAADDQIVGRR